MKQFAVFQHPALGYEAVKIGWSWPAFFFTWIWALVKQLWLVGVIVFVLGSFVDLAIGMIVLGIVSALFESFAFGLYGGFLFWPEFPEILILRGWLLGELIISVVMGTKGNGLRARRLRDCGYVEVAVVQARTPEGALAVHVTSQRNQSAVAPEGIVR